VHLQQLQFFFSLSPNFLDKVNKTIAKNTRTTPTKVSAGVSGVEIIDSPNQAKPKNIKR